MTENPGVDLTATLHSSDGTGVIHLKGRYETDVDDLWSALTDPQRLARWYGNVEGDLRVGGEFTAFVNGSEWDGRGRVDECEPPRRFRVSKWEDEGAVEVVTAELVSHGDHTMLEVEVRGLAVDKLWAYGAGWQALAEDLAAHLGGQSCADWGARWEELAPSYREMTVEPLA